MSLLAIGFNANANVSETPTGNFQVVANHQVDHMCTAVLDDAQTLFKFFEGDVPTDTGRITIKSNFPSYYKVSVRSNWNDTSAIDNEVPTHYNTPRYKESFRWKMGDKVLGIPDNGSYSTYVTNNISRSFTSTVYPELDWRESELNVGNLQLTGTLAIVCTTNAP
ncbi:hypothetical protein C1N51_27500 (plasmid) [Vibrio campbellii]|nr:hypothetical protein C1N51_27500 [Vibrio campbellii]